MPPGPRSVANTNEYGLTDEDLALGVAHQISNDRKTIVTSESTLFGAFHSLVKLDWPIGAPSEDGDMNFDNVVDAVDIDLQTAAIRQYPKATFHDLDFSGQVDGNDLNHLIKTTLNTWFGDANLDGEFNTADLVTVFQAGQYEDGVPANSGWASGDWNGDQEFSTSDLVVAFVDGGYEKGRRAEAKTVPEPASLSAGTIQS